MSSYKPNGTPESEEWRTVQRAGGGLGKMEMAPVLPWIFLLWMHLLLLAILSSSSLAANAGEESMALKKTSGSVLAALLESPYTEFVELVGRASYLEVLEKQVSRGYNVTIFAPRNAYLEQHLDGELKAFLMHPGNHGTLRNILEQHVIVGQSVAAADFNKSSLNKKLTHSVVAPDSIVRRDGIVHGINALLIPDSVDVKFPKLMNREIPSAVFPTSSPEFEHSTGTLAAGKSLSLPSDFEEPSSGMAPAPAPSSGFDIYSWEDVTDFVDALASYGGYGEMADLLVNLTSFAFDLAKLVNEGHRLTLLAPNDHAIDNITLEQLNEPGGIEALLMYHVLTEYQTEDSLYGSVRRLGKVSFSTLRVPHRITAQEADGSVQFGEGDSAAYVFDHDIHTDGKISVQGISKVLLPPAASNRAPANATGPAAANATAVARRGLAESLNETSSSKRLRGLSALLVACFLSFSLLFA